MEKLEIEIISSSNEQISEVETDEEDIINDSDNDLPYPRYQYQRR